jgi:hypothetical protein
MGQGHPTLTGVDNTHPQQSPEFPLSTVLGGGDLWNFCPEIFQRHFEA